MNFGQALAALLNGRAITRTGWSRSGMQLGLQAPTGKINQPFIYIQLANGDCQVWTPNQADILSPDWQMASPPGAREAGAEQGQKMATHDPVNA
jgi:Protein of unknown function (DUF2829)